jgi:hypothetical protein
MRPLKAPRGVVEAVISLGARVSLASIVGLVVLLGSAQAASAWHLTSVSPTTGCPNTTIKFRGTSFSGKEALAEWRDP